MKLRGRLVICIITGMLLVGCFLCRGVFGDGQSVSLTLTPKPKIDIALSKRQTNVSLSNFETDIKNQLKNLGVDTNDVEVNAIETETFSTSTSSASSIMSTWKKYPTLSDSKFQANWTLDGDTMYTKANVHWTGYWNESAKNDSDYTIEVSIQNPDNDPCGYTFRMQQPGTNEYKFYAVELDNNHDTVTLARIDSWIPSSSDQTHGGPLFHTQISSHDGTYSTWQTQENGNGLNHCIGDRLTYVSYPFSNGTWYNLKIEAKGNNFKIYINNSKQIDYTDNSSSAILSGGYGPYTASDPNGRFKGSVVKTESVKSLTEIMRLPEWREEAYKFLVHVEDYQNTDLSNNSIFGELVSKMLNEGIYFVGWGNSNNKTQFEKLIQLNGGNGKFLSDTSYNNNINSTANYIKEIIGSLKSSQYVVLNEPLAISADPPNVLNNTIDTKWPYGKWRIDHNYTYFTNDLGQFTNADRYINDFITVFDKVGEFKATYEDIPINPTSIYVHRRPVASFDMKKNATSVTLTSNSKDLDTNTNGNGIQQEEWKWIDTSTNTWNTGKLSSISTSKDYIVQLRAKDYQDTWSLPVSKYITSNTNAPPIALFNFESSKISKYENLQIKDKSYDPAGRDITTRKWEVIDSAGRSIYSGSSPLLNYNSKGIGKYTMYLTVTNSANKTSEKFGRSFEITNDVIAPEVVVNPADSDWAKSVNVSMTFTDRGGSNFKSYKYAITDSEETPTVWENEINKSTDTIVIADEGIKYLHIIGYDNDNNASAEKVLGPYKIDKTGPTLEIRTEENTGKMEAIIEDKGAGIEKYKIDIEGENAGGKITHTTDWVTKYKEKQKITHSWEHLWVKGDVKVKAVDIVGNENEFTARISNTDDSKPTVTLKTQPTYKGTETCPACGQEAHKVSWVAEFKDDKSGAPWYLENSSAQVDGVNGETNIGHLVMEKTVRQGELEGLYEESMYIHLPYIYQYKSAQYPRIWIDQYMNESDVLWINWNININR